MFLVALDQGWPNLGAPVPPLPMRVPTTRDTDILMFPTIAEVVFIFEMKRLAPLGTISLILVTVVSTRAGTQVT